LFKLQGFSLRKRGHDVDDLIPILLQTINVEKVPIQKDETEKGKEISNDQPKPTPTQPQPTQPQPIEQLIEQPIQPPIRHNPIYLSSVIVVAAILMYFIANFLYQ
jgi:hypothetical protein